MRRTIAAFRLIRLFLHNWRIYRKNALWLAWDDAVSGIDSAEYSNAMLAEMLAIPVEYPVDPFGRYKEINERLNHEG